MQLCEWWCHAGDVFLVLPIWVDERPDGREGGNDGWMHGGWIELWRAMFWSSVALGLTRRRFHATERTLLSV